MGEAQAAETLDLDTTGFQRMSSSTDIPIPLICPIQFLPISKIYLKDFSHHLESRANQIISQCSEVEALEAVDLDTYLGHLKEELNLMESKNAKLSNEIGALTKTYVEGIPLSLDKDEIIVAHMIGGVDAFIKVCQGWPVSNNALKLQSLKSSDHNSTGISLTYLCKMSNFLDVSIRRNISSFVDDIEEILVQQMRTEYGVHVPGIRLFLCSSI